MGLTITKLFQKLFSEREMSVDMVGLDAAGKSTILHKLKLGEIVTTIPTIGRALTETESNLTPQVPASIAVPRYRLQVIVHAKGHQHYRCDGSAWVLFNGAAVLYNLKWKEVGVHYFLETPDAQGGQPTWDTLPSKGVDFSSVTGKPFERAVVDANSIAWVLLEATQSHGSKEHFGDVAPIQRYNTKGGLPPSSIDGAGTGDVRKSPYSADYSFYIRL